LISDIGARRERPLRVRDDRLAPIRLQPPIPD
jgi:hypothetical protein